MPNRIFVSTAYACLAFTACFIFHLLDPSFSWDFQWQTTVFAGLTAGSIAASFKPGWFFKRGWMGVLTAFGLGLAITTLTIVATGLIVGLTGAYSRDVFDGIVFMTMIAIVAPPINLFWIIGSLGLRMMMRRGLT